MADYVYGGAATRLGRFAAVTQGQVLDLDAQEVVSVADDSDFFALPVRGQKEKKVTGNYTLLAADVGKKVLCNHSSAMELTLPAAPSVGDWFEMYHGENSSGDIVTVEPGETYTIDGVSTDKRVADSVVVTGAGTGFTSIPTVTFTGGDGSGAVAAATMKLLTAPPSANGTGYAIGDTIDLGGGTSSITAVATVATALLASATLAAAGTGYAIADTITFTGGTGTDSIVDVATCLVVGTPAIATAGTGYSADDVLTVVGGTGTAATITVTTVGGSGEITGISLTTGGDYSVLPSNDVAVTGGGGSGAEFTLAWGVLTVTVNTAGDYSVLPSNPVAQGSTSGGGSGATFTAAWGVLTTTITTAGAYTATPSNAVAQGATSGSGTGVTFTATWGVLSIAVSVGGEGYTSAPTVGFTGGGGSGATATCSLAVIPGNYSLTAAIDSVGMYFDGAEWKIFA